MDQFALPINPVALHALLSPSRDDERYPEDLATAESYLRYAASCVQILPPRVVDPGQQLNRFEEVFLASTQVLGQVSPDLAARAREIESKLDLSQNVVRLSMVTDLRLNRTPSALGTLATLMVKGTVGIDVRLDFPGRGEVRADQSTLVAVRGALTRLASVMSSGVRAAERWLEEDRDVLVIEDFYDPRRIAKASVAQLLSKARDQILNSRSISPEIKHALQTELGQTIDELRKPKPVWNSVFSRLSQVVILLAALTAIGADVDDAYKNIQAALNVMSHTSVVHPQPGNSLPRPRHDDTPPGFVVTEANTEIRTEDTED